MDVVFLSFRWGHREPGFEFQSTCVQQENHSRLCLLLTLVYHNGKTQAISQHSRHWDGYWEHLIPLIIQNILAKALSYSPRFMSCRTCFCPKCDRWFSDKKSTRASTERGRGKALHPGGICLSPDEIQTAQYCWGNPAGLLWWAWDSPRTHW